MSLSTQPSDEDGQYVLVAKVDNARNVSNILKAVHFKEREVSSIIYQLVGFFALNWCDSMDSKIYRLRLVRREYTVAPKTGLGNASEFCSLDPSPTVPDHR